MEDDPQSFQSERKAHDSQEHQDYHQCDEVQNHRTHDHSVYFTDFRRVWKSIQIRIGSIPKTTTFAKPFIHDTPLVLITNHSII